MSGLDPTTRFLIGLAVLLVLSRAARGVALRVGQPPVLAEILTGVALGPTLLGRALPALHRALFGADTMPMLNGLAQLGLALYAFEIGHRLAAPAAPAGPGRRQDGAAGRSLRWLTAVSLLLPATAAVLITGLLGGRRLQGTHGGPVPLAVFLAAALGVTAVPVLARLLHDRGLEHTRVGRLSLASASLGDGVCWCLLAVALACAGLIGTLQLVLGVAGAGAAVFLMHRRHTRPSSAAGSRSWGMAPMVAVVCLAAASSGAVGLHPMLGALLLGAAWPTAWLGPGTADRLRSTAATLLPCFFLGTGQQIDVGGALAAPGFLPLVLVLLVGAVATKLVACAVTGRLLGLGPREAVRLGVLMNAKGLTEIVVLTAGYQAGLVSPLLFEALLVVALVTTLLTGPALAALGGGNAAPAEDPTTAPAADPEPAEGRPVAAV